MSTIHLFIVEPSEEVRNTIAQTLGDDDPWIGHDSLAQLAQAIDGGHVPAIVVTGPGIVHDDTLMLASSVREEGVAVALIQVAKTLEPDALRSALRAGVTDVVELDGPVDEIRGAVERARGHALRVTEQIRALAVNPPLPPTAPMLALVAGKGGVGTSFVTTNLAAALAADGVDVVVIDLDVASGDLAIMMRQRPSLTVVDALHQIDHLDMEALSGYLLEVRENLRLLCAPLDGADEIDSVTFFRLVDVINPVTDLVVIDVGDGLSQAAKDVLAAADHIVVVTNRELTGIRGTRLVLARVTMTGRPRDTITVVANQANESTGLAISDVEKALATEVDHQVPSDKSAAQSVNRGEPIIDRRRSRTGDAIRQLASRIATELDLA